MIHQRLQSLSLPKKQKKKASELCKGCDFVHKQSYLILDYKSQLLIYHIAQPTI